MECLELLRLDFTLWDLQVDKYSSPFCKTIDGDIIDSLGNVARLYPEVLKCLQSLKSLNIPMAIASRAGDITGAYQLLYFFNIRDYFEQIEIYPTGKGLHFRRLNNSTGINFEDMFFYDDDYRNIRTISKLGVNCTLVESGLSLEYLKPIIHRQLK